MTTQRKIDAFPRGEGIGMPHALVAIVIAIAVIGLVLINVSARGPVHPTTPIRPSAAVLVTPTDDRPPHLQALPPARGDLVQPGPTTRARVPEWEDFDPTH